MGKVKTPVQTKRNHAPKRTLEGEEGLLVMLATDLARKQMQDGTASSQVITHFLKLGSTREKLEKELLIQELELKKAKTRQIETYERIETLYASAIEAMKTYSGLGGSDND